jgi:uncharacterized protein (TIGR03435 family)
MEPILVRSSLLALLSFVACGQVPAPPPVFEVASVKLNGAAIRGSVEFSKGGERFTAVNMPLGALLLIAYHVTVRQLLGPEQAFSERYDVLAKAEYPVSANEMLNMLQALLVERFKLAVRRETREVPVFALTIAKGGPRLRLGDPPESGAAAIRTPARAGGAESASGHLTFKNESMPDFAWALSRMAGIGDRVVVDNTGLDGAYDFELAFERDASPGSDGREPGARLGPTLFSALQEQLGLKLESKKAPVEFIVIGHVDRPSAN